MLVQKKAHRKKNVVAIYKRLEETVKAACMPPDEAAERKALLDRLKKNRDLRRDAPFVKPVLVNGPLTNFGTYWISFKNQDMGNL